MPTIDELRARLDAMNDSPSDQPGTAKALLANVAKFRAGDGLDDIERRRLHGAKTSLSERDWVASRIEAKAAEAQVKERGLELIGGRPNEGVEAATDRALERLALKVRQDDPVLTPQKAYATATATPTGKAIYAIRAEFTNRTLGDVQHYATQLLASGALLLEGLRKARDEGEVAT